MLSSALCGNRLILGIKSSLIYARPQILWPYSQFSQSNTKYKMSNRTTKRRIYSFQILKCRNDKTDFKQNNFHFETAHYVGG